MNFLKKLTFTNGFRPLMSRAVTSPVLVALFLNFAPETWAKGRTAETADETPEMEMLEFLGSFEDKDTGWMDPFELEAMAKAKETSEEESNGR